MTRRTERVTALFDILAGSPEGLTVDDMAAALGVSHHLTSDAIRELRLLLGDTDEINLICDPQGSRERWLYRLVGNLDGSRRWVANRLGDTESRLRTMQSIADSLVSATDGRTLDGRRARLIRKALVRLVEDLDELVV